MNKLTVFQTLSRNGPAGPSAGNGRPVLMMAGRNRSPLQRGTDKKDGKNV